MPAASASFFQQLSLKQRFHVTGLLLVLIWRNAALVVLPSIVLTAALGLSSVHFDPNEKDIAVRLLDRSSSMPMAPSFAGSVMLAWPLLCNFVAMYCAGHQLAVASYDWTQSPNALLFFQTRLALAATLLFVVCLAASVLQRHGIVEHGYTTTLYISFIVFGFVLRNLVTSRVGRSSFGRRMTSSMAGTLVLLMYLHWILPNFATQSTSVKTILRFGSNIVSASIVHIITVVLSKFPRSIAPPTTGLDEQVPPQHTSTIHIFCVAPLCVAVLGGRLLQVGGFSLVESIVAELVACAAEANWAWYFQRQSLWDPTRALVSLWRRISRHSSDNNVHRLSSSSVWDFPILGISVVPRGPLEGAPQESVADSGNAAQASGVLGRAAAQVPGTLGSCNSGHENSLRLSPESVSVNPFRQASLPSQRQLAPSFHVVRTQAEPMRSAEVLCTDNAQRLSFSSVLNFPIVGVSVVPASPVDGAPQNLVPHGENATQASGAVGSAVAQVPGTLGSANSGNEISWRDSVPDIPASEVSLPSQRRTRAEAKRSTEAALRLTSLAMSSGEHCSVGEAFFSLLILDLLVAEATASLIAACILFSFRVNLDPEAVDFEPGDLLVNSIVALVGEVLVSDVAVACMLVFYWTGLSPSVMHSVWNHRSAVCRSGWAAILLTCTIFLCHLFSSTLCPRIGVSGTLFYKPC